MENSAAAADSIAEYSVLLETLLRYELNESGVSEYWWDGKFTKIGESLLTYYKADKDLSPAAMKLAQWRVYCNVQADYRLAYGLFNDVLEQVETAIVHHADAYSEQQLSDFWTSTTKMLEYTMCSLERFKFDNEKRAMNMLKVLQRISSLVQMCKLGMAANNFFASMDVQSEVDKRARTSIEEMVVEALSKNAKNWFQAEISKPEETKAGTSMEEQRIERVSAIAKAIKTQLEFLTAKYQGIFKK